MKVLLRSFPPTCVHGIRFFFHSSSSFFSSGERSAVAEVEVVEVVEVPVVPVGVVPPVVELVVLPDVLLVEG